MELLCPEVTGVLVPWRCLVTQRKHYSYLLE